MPIKTLIFLIITIFFTACGGKQNPYAKPQDTLHEQSLMQTKKATLLNDKKEVVAYVVATYLNQVDNSTIEVDIEDTETFLVGVYTGEKSSVDLLEEVSFQIGSHEVGCYSKLTRDNPLLELVSSGNPWMQYYLLYAPKVSAKNVPLTVNTESYGSITLNFQRDIL